MKVDTVEGILLEERGHVKFEMPTDVQYRYQIDIGIYIWSLRTIFENCQQTSGI